MSSSSRFDINTKGTDLIQELEPRIAAKTILVTGVSPGGLGAFFVESLSALQNDSSPKLLILAGRNLSKLQQTAAKIRFINPSISTKALILDLGSFASVRAAAKDINETVEKIDVLVNNAGIMAPPYSKTEDDFESTFQANHLSHFLFTNLIMPKLLAAKEPRVVIVSSDGYRLGHVRYNDYNFRDGETYHPWLSYGQSKSANLLFARSLASKLGPKSLTAIAIHPGVITSSNLGGHLNEDLLNSLREFDRRIGWSQEGFEAIGEDQGIATHVFAAFSPEVKDFNGGYLEKLYRIPFPDEEIYPWAIGGLEARKCWELSEKLVGEKFEY